MEEVQLAPYVFFKFSPTDMDDLEETLLRTCRDGCLRRLSDTPRFSKEFEGLNCEHILAIPGIADPEPEGLLPLPNPPTDNLQVKPLPLSSYIQDLRNIQDMQQQKINDLESKLNQLYEFGSKGQRKLLAYEGFRVLEEELTNVLRGLEGILSLAFCSTVSWATCGKPRNSWDYRGKLTTGPRTKISVDSEIMHGHPNLGRICSVYLNLTATTSRRSRRAIRKHAQVCGEVAWNKFLEPLRFPELEEKEQQHLDRQREASGRGDNEDLGLTDKDLGIPPEWKTEL